MVTAEISCVYDTFLLMHHIIEIIRSCWSSLCTLPPSLSLLPSLLLLASLSLLPSLPLLLECCLAGLAKAHLANEVQQLPSQHFLADVLICPFANHLIRDVLVDGRPILPECASPFFQSIDLSLEYCDIVMLKRHTPHQESQIFSAHRTNCKEHDNKCLGVS